MERERFAIDQIDKAQSDFTSLGRWGWGLAITFLTSILLKSADSAGDLFPSIHCPKGEELGRPFLGVIFLGTSIYVYFVWRACRRLVGAISHARSLAARQVVQRDVLQDAIKSAPAALSLFVAMALRIAIILPLVGIWWAVFDVGTSRAELVGDTKSALTKTELDEAVKKHCENWLLAKRKS